MSPYSSSSQRVLFKASVFGLLARNCIQLEAPEEMRRSDEFLDLSLNAIESIIDTNPLTFREQILNSPNLEWVRTTKKFDDLWARLYAKKENP